MSIDVIEDGAGYTVLVDHQPHAVGLDLPTAYRLAWDIARTHRDTAVTITLPPIYRSINWYA